MQNSKQNNRAALDRILNKTLKYAKQVAKDFYFNEWAEHLSQCPAFGDGVVNVTREGWEHIIDETSRTKSDILGRLFCLRKSQGTD